DRPVLAGRLIAALNRQHKNAPHVGAFFIVGAALGPRIRPPFAGAPVPARIRGPRAAPCMFPPGLRLSYRRPPGRPFAPCSSLTDFVRRSAPRLIADTEESPEACKQDFAYKVDAALS